MPIHSNLPLDGPWSDHQHAIPTNAMLHQSLPDDSKEGHTSSSSKRRTKIVFQRYCHGCSQITHSVRHSISKSSLALKICKMSIDLGSSLKIDFQAGKLAGLSLRIVGATILVASSGGHDSAKMPTFLIRRLGLVRLSDSFWIIEDPSLLLLSNHKENMAKGQHHLNLQEEVDDLQRYLGRVIELDRSNFVSLMREGKSAKQSLSRLTDRMPLDSSVSASYKLLLQSPIYGYIDSVDCNFLYAIDQMLDLHEVVSIWLWSTEHSSSDTHSNDKLEYMMFKIVYCLHAKASCLCVSGKTKIQVIHSLVCYLFEQFKMRTLLLQELRSHPSIYEVPKLNHGTEVVLVPDIQASAKALSPRLDSRNFNSYLSTSHPIKYWYRTARNQRANMVEHRIWTNLCENMPLMKICSGKKEPMII